MEFNMLRGLRVNNRVFLHTFENTSTYAADSRWPRAIVCLDDFMADPTTTQEEPYICSRLKGMANQVDNSTMCIGSYCGGLI